MEIDDFSQKLTNSIDHLSSHQQRQLLKKNQLQNKSRKSNITWWSTVSQTLYDSIVQLEMSCEEWRNWHTMTNDRMKHWSNTSNKIKSQFVKILKSFEKQKRMQKNRSLKWAKSIVAAFRTVQLYQHRNQIKFITINENFYFTMVNNRRPKRFDSIQLHNCKNRI